MAVPGAAGPSGPEAASAEDALGAPVGVPGSAPQDTPAAGTGSVTASSTVTQPNTGAPPATNELRVEVTAPSEAASTTSMLVSMGPAILSQTFFTLIFLFFLLASGDLLYLRIVQSFDTLKEKRAAYDALRELSLIHI